ncbi:MAG: alpha-hydroxy-acid oxidizing protein [Acidobacteria bacterium]|nr:alpha-hydroxy-acid oxidizing protein [Acidobacteriota bacterium]
MTVTRRDALRNLFIWLAGSPLLRGQQEIQYTPERIPLMDDLVNVLEFEPVSKTKIPKTAYDFVNGGVDSEWTLRRNREAFNWITLRPRVLANEKQLDLSCELFGTKIEMPILVAPTGTQGLSHPEGELAMVRGAGAAKTIDCVSSNTNYTIDKIGDAATFPIWFQLYPGPDPAGTRERVERAIAAGAKVIALTVDTPYNSHRERLLRDRVAQEVPPGGATPNLVERPGRRRAVPTTPNRYRLTRRFTAELGWSFVDELCSYAKVPVLTKGILTPEDAKRSIEHGAAGVIVSNHGARYLDTVPSTIEVLPEIVDAVGGKGTVLVDSGFRRGTDILKALAIGAKAVLVGRPPLWGLGAYGQAGVTRVLELLQTELALAMGLAGCPTLASINRSLVHIEPQKSRHAGCRPRAFF